MSGDPAYLLDAVADRKAAELIERYGVVTITQGDYEKLVRLVGTAYLQGARDELAAARDRLRGDGE